MNELDLVNEPVEFQLSDRKIKFRKMPISKRRSIMQSYLLGQLISEVQDKANILYADDRDAREKYIVSEMTKLPSGQKLIDEIGNVRITGSLIIKMIQSTMVDVKMTDIELEELLNDADDAQVQSLYQFIHGLKKK